MNITMNDVATPTQLESAFQWLFKRRRNHPPDSDVWDFRRTWDREKEGLREKLIKGEYSFSPLRRISLANGEIIDMWCSRDALVLKCLANVLGKYLPISKSCYHIKGHGGAKGAVRSVMKHLGDNRFVLKTDIEAYYASIEHNLLVDRLARVTKDTKLLNLLWRFMKRCTDCGGNYWEFDCGISRGCPLSPILGAYFLNELDTRIEGLGLFYVRFMDDIVVLSPTRWKLKKAVRVLNQVSDGLQLKKHPDKTFIGKTSKGFDFLGYRLERERVKVAFSSLLKCAERISRLYEQDADLNRIALYVQRWHRWAYAGFREFHRQGHF